MTQDSKQTTLSTLINDHSHQWNLGKNERLSAIVQNVVDSLTVKKEFKKDAVLALYVLSNELNVDINKLIDDLRKGKESDVGEIARMMFEKQNANAHVEQVLISLHQSSLLEDLYSPNQFYHQIHRFCHKAMTIPKGYTLMFANVKENTHLLVNTDQAVSLKEVFDSAYFGFFMKNADQLELSSMAVDFVSDNQKADIIKNLNNLTVMTSTELVKQYFQDIVFETKDKV